MKVVSIVAIMKTEPNGTKKWVGWVNPGEEVPKGLNPLTLNALDPEDGTDARWLLAEPEAATYFTAEQLSDLDEGEMKRKAMAKLSDEELSMLKMSRDD